MRLSGMPQDLAAEFAIPYTVGQDGTVNIPLIGEMKVSGLTANQVEREIQAKLISEKIFTHPTVVINIGGAVRFVSVGGGVRAPQRLQWSQDLTLHTAIDNVGGLDDFGNPKGVKFDPGRQDYPNLRSARFGEGSLSGSQAAAGRSGLRAQISDRLGRRIGDELATNWRRIGDWPLKIAP